MIRPQRRAHRVAFTGLALAIPTLLILASRARVPPTRVERLPVELEMPSAHALYRDWLMQDSSGAHYDEPDALVYWSATEPADGELPADARLLGLLTGGDLLGGQDGGWTIVFSLARGEVLKATPWSPAKAPR